jgi:hypothetical protein
MISLSVPWPIELSTSELVTQLSSRVEEVFEDVGAHFRAAWPQARCATAEFWEQEVRFPAGMYVPTKEGLVLTNWWPEETEEGDD